MPSPNILDIPKLLAPISKEKPTGENLRADPSPNSLYYLIRGARTAARNAEKQLVPGDEATSTPPDWRPVLEQGKKALMEKTKDLEITAYMIEALVRLHGYAGLRDGFRLARGLTEQFWDGLYPLPDEEGQATRVWPLAGLNGEDETQGLYAPINKVAITEGKNGRLSCAHYHQARELMKISDAKVRDKKIGEGALTPEKFQEGVTETSSKFFVNLVEDLQQATEEFAKLGADLDKRLGPQAPPTTIIRKALDSCLSTIKEVVPPDKLIPPPPKEDIKPGQTKDGAQTQAGAAQGAAGALRTREDAFTELKRVADFFRRTEPQSIVPPALEQVIRWGRASLQELLTELITDEGPRKSLFKQVGIKSSEPEKKDTPKK
jgi:type VI secretion system protein ImpA